MRGILIGAALAFTAFAPSIAAAETNVATCSRAEPGGDRTLCHDAVISAPVAQVWDLWATAEGLRSWAVPVAAIEPRVGGTFKSSYNPDTQIGDAANIRNRIVAAVPNTLLILQIAHAPPGFAHEDEARTLATVIELAPIDATHTRVRISMLGYREGAAFDELYRMFEWGNAWSLGKLEQRVTSGPIDWRAEAAARAR